MSDELGAQGASAPAPVESMPSLAAEGAVTTSDTPVAPAPGTNAIEDAKSASAAGENSEASKVQVDSTTDAKLSDAAAAPSDNVATEGAEIEGTGAEASAASAAGEADAAPAADDKKARRKSAGVPEHKGKKLTKSKSKSKLTHADAQPGDHFYIRLKGYPPWPGIIADEDMLPDELVGVDRNKRPAMARKKDGEWREDLKDGGKNVNERMFPVMFLSTNEFSWTRNTDLTELDFETVGEPPKKGGNALKEAHALAAEQHDLAYYKQILNEFKEAREARAAEIAAKENEKAEKAAAAAARKAAGETKKTSGKAKRKSTLSEAAVDEEEDVEMADADGSTEMDPEEPKTKTKKRKAEDGASTPARSDSVKKPKIKINNTPKANGADTPKSSTKKEPKPKATKKKTNGATNGDGSSTPKEPELTEEEKRQKKEKEILFLRHKLQKGLLIKDQPPKDEEMKQMSEFIAKLEGYAELEVSIIRATKINKVLKAILKLEEIPRENEFNFKTRSDSLLAKWNKILEGASEAAPAATPTAAPVEEKKELVNGNPKPEEPEIKKAADVKPAELPKDTTMVDAPATESNDEPVKPTLEPAPLESTTA